MKRPGKPTPCGIVWFRWILVLLLLFSGVLTSPPVVMAAPQAPQSPAAAAWTAYNDSAWQSGQSNPANTTTILGASGTGTLRNFDTGALTGVTATFTSDGSPTMYANSGAATNSGTDAYSTFNGKANMTGVVNYGSSSGWYIDLTLTGLNPARPYTFATTANRNDSGYTTRVSRYTISGVDAATNASTFGTSLYNDDPYAVYFVTGYNTVNGYVARWTGIQPGSDGSFKVRAQANGSVNEAYGFSVFMLSEDATTDPTITTTGTLSAFTSQPGVASAEQSYTVSAVNLTENLVITAPTDFQISTTSGSGFGSSVSLTQSGGNVASTTIYVRFNRATAGTSDGNITHTSAGATQKDVAVSGTASNCVTVSLQQGTGGYTGARDAHIGQANPTYNYGAATPLMVDSDEPSGSSNDVSALLYWDLASIPAGSTIQSASVAIYVEDVTASPGFDLYDMTQAWTEGTGTGSATGDGATWNTYDGSNSWPGGAGGASDRGSAALANFTPTSTGSYQASLNTTGLAMLESWINIPANNKGFMVHAGSTTNGLDFTSKEGTTVTNRPKLSITYCAPTGPTVTVASAMTAFTTQPGVPSPQQSYTVSGSNLTDDITITLPADFEVSLTSGSGFGTAPIVLARSGTSVAPTTIYVRFNRVTEGSSSGSITHTSASAIQKDVAVSGTASNCTTVSLVAAADTYLSANDVTFNNGGNTALHVNGTTGTDRRTTLLKWDVSGIPSSATMSAASITLYVTDASTAAYNLYNMRRSWVEGTGNRTASTTSANWNTYDGANSWGTEGAADTSSDRYDTNLWSAGTTTFNATGSKTAALNADGVAVVQGWVAGITSNYGLISQNYSGSTNTLYFSSREATTEANRPKLNVTYCAGSGTYYTLSVGNDGNGTVNLSPAGGVYLAGTVVTLTPAPNSGYAFATWSGPNAADPSDNGNGTWSLTMDGNKSLTANFTQLPENLAPNQPVLVQPADNATGIATAPSLEVTAQRSQRLRHAECQFLWAG